VNERGVSYRRLSQDGKSLPEQLEEIEAYAEARGIEIGDRDHYSDGTHASGYTAEREAYQELLERIREGDVDHVVVRDRSRLARDAKDRLRLFLELDSLGVDVHIAETEETVDLEDPYALTRESAQADADDREKRKEAERGRAEAERREELGLPNGPAPTGLQYGPAKEELVPGEEYDVVLDVFARRLDEPTPSWREIAADVEVSHMTASRIWSRRERYVRAGERARDRGNLQEDLADQLEEISERLGKAAAN